MLYMRPGPQSRPNKDVKYFIALLLNDYFLHSTSTIRVKLCSGLMSGTRTSGSTSVLWQKFLLSTNNLGAISLSLLNKKKIM